MTGFEDLSGIPTRGLRAPKDSLFFSDLAYDVHQSALFSEGTLSLTDEFSLTGGLRYTVRRRQGADLRRHLRQRQQRHVPGVAAWFHRRERRGAASDRDL